MIHALDRLRLLTTGAVVALLVVTLAVVVFRGFEEGTLTSADAPSDVAPGDSARSGSSPPPKSADGPEAGEAPTETGGASDLALVSQDVVLPSSSSSSPPTSASAGTSPRGPSASAATIPTSSVPGTPTAPPTSSPVTPPTTSSPSAPPTPPAPAPPVSKPAVVNVGVLSGGQLLSVDLNPGASNLVNLSLLQP